MYQFSLVDSFLQFHHEPHVEFHHHVLLELLDGEFL